MNAPRQTLQLSPAQFRTARWGALLWPSFFAAGVATMVFFAIVDPIELAELTWPHAAISRKLGYTIGFFMFWSCTFSSSLFTAWLLYPLKPSHRDRSSTEPP